MTNPRFLKLVPVLFVLLWSTGFIGAKYSMPYAEPFTLLAIRMSLAAIIIFFISLRVQTIWPDLKTAVHSGISGILIHAVYLGGIFSAIKQGMPAGMAALIVGMQPLLTAVLARLWMDDRITYRQTVGLFLGLFGVILVLAFRQPQGVLADITLTGLFFTLASVVSISVGALYQKRYCGNTSLLAGTFYQYVATGIVMCSLAFAFETREVQWTASLVFALAWLVIVLSLAAVLLLMLMIRQGQSTAVASYFYLTPPVTVLLSWFLFGEELGITAIAGLAIACIGVYLARPTAATK